VPAKSKKQFRFMKMMEHNPEKAKSAAPGLSKEEAAEYTESNVGKKSYSKLPEEKKNKDHFAPHLDHPQVKSAYPGSKITGKCGKK
jgi:hypothetical protein